MNFKFLFVLFIAIPPVFAQKTEYSTVTIADSLKQNANAIIRLNQMDIDILSQRSMIVKNKRIVSVLNEKGLGAIEAYENYDKELSIKKIEATVYNSFGIEIKKIKRKDFKDQSAVDGGTLFSDSRVLYLDYTPTEYPFTIVYDCEVETSNTAFIPQWNPIYDYYVSLEKGILNVKFPDNLGFKKKDLNFKNFKIAKTTDTSTELSYVVINVIAQKEEDYSSLNTVFPRLMMGLESFHLEGVDGNAKTWKEFGQWYSDKILKGTTELSEDTKAKIKLLVGDEKNSVAKAKIIYDFLQQKSRYVSVQVGIGGWKPMLAKDVDRLGYGDCKALTNYTKALLNEAGVPSYYTVLYGDRNKRSIDSDFVSMQGNHVILSIPVDDKLIWLECTSQEDPFGYQGTFTDDRDVLIIKPDGGEIVHTNVYNDKENSQISKGFYSISETGDFSGQITITSEGTQYNSKFGLNKKTPLEKEKHYKEYWDNISNLKINKNDFLNDKNKISFTENVEISAINYANVTADRMLFVVNAFNKNSRLVRKIKNRKNAFEIQRGYYDEDEIEINLPLNFKIEALSTPFELNSKFGDYKTEIVNLGNDKLVYKRTMLLKKGLYTNNEYEEYRLFMEQISRNDNAKTVLIKKQ